MQTKVNALLATADVARLADPPVTPAAVREWAKAGKLPIAAVTPGGQRLFRREDVLAFLRERAGRD
jgi:excisionase family DNA binding protein